MQVSFTTKEESKRKQEEEFLALTPSERVMAFFKLSREILRKFPTQAKDKTKGNLILEKRKPLD